VTATTPTAVYVDVGAKTEGVIPGRELERMNRETLELLKPGAVVSVYVVNPHAHNGELLLSLNRALEEMDWQRAEEHRVSQQVYNSHVAGYNKGGLIVRFGRLRGFVPQSQLGADRRRLMSGETPEDRWGKMVNETIAVKVMEVDRARNRLILSERAADRESRETRKESLVNQLQVGEVRIGRVVSLVDFGAFIDVGGAEGLVHLTELSWKHVTHPREILRVGQEVKVEVISVDPDQKRIGLSLKRQEADPWDTVAVSYNIGQLVQGIVTKMTKFGVFIRLVELPEIEGLVHISELSDQRVNHPREVLNEGETITLRVVKMDIENRRLGLSLKRVNSAEYLDMDWQTSGGTPAQSEQGASES
jgi:small subunit ribosomal protein S1